MVVLSIEITVTNPDNIAILSEYQIHIKSSLLLKGCTYSLEKEIAEAIQGQLSATFMKMPEKIHYSETRRAL